MTETHLTAFYEQLLKRQFPALKMPVVARFTGSKKARHAIVVRRRVVEFQISGVFRTAPLRVLSLLGYILTAKLLRENVEPALRKQYNAYVQMKFAQQKSAVRKPSARYTPIGKYFNLDEIFDEINRAYFGGKLPRPILGWSLNKAYTRLGFYDAQRNLLVISKIFDNKKTPPEVVRYMMYHEMLHIALPAKKGPSGRRKIHTSTFRELERQFPDYERITRWIAKYRHRL